MFRARHTVLVKYGHFKEFFEIEEQLALLVGKRGWAERRAWVPVAGRDNELTTETEHETLDKWQRESEAWHLDGEVMDLVRRQASLVEPGSSTTTLEETAFGIA